MLAKTYQKLYNIAIDLPLVTVALLITLPLLWVSGFIFFPFNDNWQHIVGTVLPDYVSNSLILVIGVSIGTLSIGITCAWLTSMCEFTGRKFFTWALLLPLALPAYIIAYTYTGILDFAGPVQTQIRQIFGLGYGDYWFPDIRSIGGAICVLSLVLYPYVYLLARSAFIEQSICVLEVSRTLGNTALQSFYKVAIPLARPAIITGLSLALMETLADYGTVQYFGVSTFTTGIFRTWFGLGDSTTAAQLSVVLLIFVFSLILLERWSRQKAKFHHTSSKYSKINRFKFAGFKSIIASLACALPLIFGFLAPAIQLTNWTLFSAEEALDPEFLTLVFNTLSLALVSALIAVSLAIFLVYARRLHPSSLTHGSIRISALGYAIPGTIIAVGVMLPFSWFDNTLDSYLRENFGISSGLILSGSLVALIFAYTVRFLSVSIQSVESGLDKIKPAMDDSGRSLGLPAYAVLKQIHLPLMRGTVLTALLLVFVDVLKELPATLILRPFNFNTLAVRTYEMASDERLADAGPPALAIVLISVIPVILLNLSIDKSRAGENA